MHCVNIRREQLVTALLLGMWAPLQADPVPTTLNDFILPGTQPNTLPTQIQTSDNCTQCHGANTDMHDQWEGSLMAHAARDPLFYACLTIANQDAPGSGELCIRCHAPRAWLDGRSTPPDASLLTAADRDSVNCMFCHKMVDPIDPFNDAPAQDAAILAALGNNVPTSLHSGMFVIDPNDNARRGPFDDTTPISHSSIYSPFHARSEMCATCHDVSNPVYTKQPDGTYAANAFDTPPADDDKLTMFPIERTYSEWVNSAFAVAPIEMNGRFGGNKTAVSTCQDCHMPDSSGSACIVNGFELGVNRNDRPSHELAGAATWQLDAIANLYPGEVNAAALANQKLKNISMLERAASLELDQEALTLRVRVINETGHKLPSGYPEGRRIWLNVIYRDMFDAIVGEYGYYDYVNADLDTASTKVYETHLGIDETISGITNIPAGHSFHFVLNNVILSDNRIPPRGFDNATWAANQIAPVDYTYEDGQYWDDSWYPIPDQAVTAEVTLYYQASSKEYIEFLRDANYTNNDGITLYNQWVATGKSAPVAMADMTFNLLDLAYGDFDADGDVDSVDAERFLDCPSLPTVPYSQECAPLDGDMDGDVDQSDLALFQLNLTPPPPE